MFSNLGQLKQAKTTTGSSVLFVRRQMINIFLQEEFKLINKRVDVVFRKFLQSYF